MTAAVVAEEEAAMASFDGGLGARNKTNKKRQRQTSAYLPRRHTIGWDLDEYSGYKELLSLLQRVAADCFAATRFTP